MRNLGYMTGPILIALLVACGGSPQQQADSVQPAAQPSSPPAETAQPPAPPHQPYGQQPYGQAAQPTAPPPAPPQRPQPRQQPPAAHTASATPAPVPAPPQPLATPKPQMTAVPAGAVLTLALDTPLNSKTAQVGHEFTATVVEAISVEGREVIPAGSKIKGTVTEAIAAKPGAGKAKLAMSFDELTLPDGYSTPIKGTFREVTASQKKKNAAVIGGSAAGGALLGRILGKDTKGAVIGAIIGGGVGTAVVMGKDGGQAKLAADTPFEIKLEEEVQIPKTSAGA